MPLFYKGINVTSIDQRYYVGESCIGIKREGDLLVTERECPGPIYTMPIPGDTAHVTTYIRFPLFIIPIF